MLDGVKGFISNHVQSEQNSHVHICTSCFSLDSYPDGGNSLIDLYALMLLCVRQTTFIGNPPIGKIHSILS